MYIRVHLKFTDACCLANNFYDLHPSICPFTELQLHTLYKIILRSVELFLNLGEMCHVISVTSNYFSECHAFPSPKSILINFILVCTLFLYIWCECVYIYFDCTTFRYIPDLGNAVVAHRWWKQTPTTTNDGTHDTNKKNNVQRVKLAASNALNDHSTLHIVALYLLYWFRFVFFFVFLLLLLLSLLHMSRN